MKHTKTTNCGLCSIENGKVEAKHTITYGDHETLSVCDYHLDWLREHCSLSFTAQPIEELLPCH